MKKYTIPQLLFLLGMPALTVVLGLVLLLSPDTASALVGKLLGWAAVLVGLGLGAHGILGAAAGRNSRILWAVICFAAGVWLLMHPLTIAKFLGRVLGLALMIRGGQAAAKHIRYQGKHLLISRSLVIAAVAVIVGAVLVILPLASSRMLFNVLGIVMICAGIAEGYDRFRGRKLLDEGQDPNIIDVEKV